MRMIGSRLGLAAGLMVTASILVSGCTSTILPKSNPPAGSLDNTKPLLVQNMEGTLPLTRFHDIPYVAVQDMCRLLELRTRWDPNSGLITIGDEDTVYELKVGSADAGTAGTRTLLPAVPIVSNSEVYIPVVSLSSVLRDEFRYDVTEERIRFYPKSVKEALTVSNMTFAQEPDEFSIVGTNGTNSGITSNRSAGARQASQRNELIQNAKRYLGVNYAFAAAPYPESGTFDCSSYTKYIFERYDISLPRTVRQQAEQGTTVSPDQLRKGDLLFFTVPGYYKSKQIGHVGIYAGDQTMIHVAADSGVTISRLDTDLWKYRFVKAQRLMP